MQQLQGALTPHHGGSAHWCPGFCPLPSQLTLMPPLCLHYVSIKMTGMRHDGKTWISAVGRSLADKSYQLIQCYDSHNEEGESLVKCYSHYHIWGNPTGEIPAERGEIITANTYNGWLINLKEKSVSHIFEETIILVQKVFAYNAANCWL